MVCDVNATELMHKLKEIVDRDGDGPIMIRVDPGLEWCSYGIEIIKVDSFRPTERNYAIVIEAISHRVS
jgi:hypothetical protein